VRGSLKYFKESTNPLKTKNIETADAPFHQKLKGEESNSAWQ
jgi:hypothetical protein